MAVTCRLRNERRYFALLVLARTWRLLRLSHTRGDDIVFCNSMSWREEGGARRVSTTPSFHRAQDKRVAMRASAFCGAAKHQNVSLTGESRRGHPPPATRHPSSAARRSRDAAPRRRRHTTRTQRNERTKANQSHSRPTARRPHSPTDSLNVRRYFISARPTTEATDCCPRALCSHRQRASPPPPARALRFLRL